MINDKPIKNMSMENVLSALGVVIAYLDAKMEESPNRELADTSNYLEKLKAELNG